MAYQLAYGDITTFKVDAIVNAANHSLLGGGGVDGAIHRAAGPELLKECMTLNGCETGKAKITKGYLLPARYVIHTVGPVYHDGKSGEPELLRSCYRNCLQTAKENGLHSVAFPLISGGVYGYPKEDAMEIAKSEITAFLAEETDDYDITLVLYRKTDLSKKARTVFQKIRHILDSASKKPGSPSVYSFAASRPKESFAFSEAKENMTVSEDDIFQEEKSAAKHASLNNSAVNQAAKFETLDEPFQKYLFHKIDESGMTDPECYKKANIDRKLFSKIRSNEKYQPSKTTALAFAIALRLSLPDTEIFLRHAGYTLSDSILSDVIIKYFIQNQNYDIYEINQILFEYDQVQLGSKP